MSHLACFGVQVTAIICKWHCLFALVLCICFQTKAEEDIGYWVKNINTSSTGRAQWCSFDAELDSNDKQ